jgi:prepilin-type N-terminal cleavage/methylation domain-containing protein
MRRNSGFTLIELMIVAAIVAILAMIALPKFAGMVRKSKEAALKGKLGTLRSAFSLYYADTEGLVPSWAGGMASNSMRLVPRYLDEIPRITIPH